MKKNAKMQPMDANELMEYYHHLPDSTFTPVQWIFVQLTEMYQEMIEKKKYDRESNIVAYILTKIENDKLFEIELKRGVIARDMINLKRKKSIIKIQNN